MMEVIKALPRGPRACYRLPLIWPRSGLMLAAGLAVLLLGLVHAVLPRPLNGFVLMVGVIGLWVMAFRLATGLLIEQAGMESDLDLLVWPGTRQAFVAFFLLALLLVIWQLMPWLLAIPFVVLWAAVAPLTVLLLARGEGLIDALYPPAWRELATELGKDALRLMAGSLLVACLAYALAGWLVSPLPNLIGSALLMLLWVYLLLAWFALLGQLWQGRFAPAQAATVPPVEACTLEQQWQTMVRDGGSLHDYRRLANALELAGDPIREQAHAQRFITALLDGFERPAEAVERADRLLLRAPDFSLEKPSEQWALIQAARRHGHQALVEQLCRNFLQRFPAAPKRERVLQVLRLMTSGGV